MRLFLLACVLVSACATPDRYSVTGGSTLAGGLESADGQRQFDSQWLEVGVSGPLGKPVETRMVQRPHEPTSEPSAPTEQPTPSGGIPWGDLALLVSGAAGGKAGEFGFRKAKAIHHRRKQARSVPSASP
jgi:hypothetical protein